LTSCPSRPGILCIIAVSKVPAEVYTLIKPRVRVKVGPGYVVASKPDPQKNRKEGLKLGWGGSVLCTRNAGALLIDS